MTDASPTATDRDAEPVVAEFPITERPDAPAARTDGARAGLGGIVAAAALGAGGPIVRIADHGQDGAVAAVVLAVSCLALAALVTAAPLRERWVQASALALLLGAEVLTVGNVGRLPAVLAAVGAVGAAFAIGTARVSTSCSARRSPLFAASIGIAGAAWALTGVGLVAAVFAVVAVTTVVVGARAAELDSADGPNPLVDDGRAVWFENRQELLAAVVAGVLGAPVIWRLAADPTVVTRGVNDYLAHWERVEALRWSPFFLSVPHPGYHVPTRILGAFLKPEVAMAVLPVAAIAATGAVLVCIGRSGLFGGGPLTGRWPLGFSALVLVTSSPAVLLPVGDAWWQRAPGYDQLGRAAGFFPLHIWGSPTITSAVPMYLALVLTALELRGRPGCRRLRLATAALVTAATLTMPAATLGLVPGATVLLVAGWARRRFAGSPWVDVGRRVVSESRAFAWLAVPGAAICVWQAWFLATSQSKYEETTWRWNPFWMVDFFDLDRPAFWLLFAVVGAGWWVGGRSFWRDPAIRWTSAATGVAWFPAFLFQETGWKATHGGLALSFFMCAAMLVLFSMRFLVGSLHEHRSVTRDAAPPPRLVVAAAVLLACVVAGSLDYLSAVGAVLEL